MVTRWLFHSYPRCSKKIYQNVKLAKGVKDEPRAVNLIYMISFQATVIFKAGRNVKVRYKYVCLSPKTAFFASFFFKLPTKEYNRDRSVAFLCNRQRKRKNLFCITKIMHIKYLYVLLCSLCLVIRCFMCYDSG